MLAARLKQNEKKNNDKKADTPLTKKAPYKPDEGNYLVVWKQ